MRVLLLGCRGMLGSEIARLAPPEVQLVALSRADLDVTDFPAVERALVRYQPEWVVNATAYTAVDAAESDREAAEAVNATAVALLGQACARGGIRILHFSTDYVFDGSAREPYREDHPTSPLGVYGASKRNGEIGLIDSGARALIVRTSWLFGPNGKSFPRTMWERASARIPTRVVTDQRGAPTYAPHLATAAWSLLAQDHEGIWHVTNSGEATWYDVAHRVFSAADATELLSPCLTAEYPTPAKRPAYSVLDTTKAVKAGITLQPWQEAVDAFVELLRTGSLGRSENASQSVAAERGEVTGSVSRL